MSLPLTFRWTDPGGPIDQVVYPEGVSTVEVLDDLVRVTTGDVTVWEGRIEDPGSES